MKMPTIRRWALSGMRNSCSKVLLYGLVIIILFAGCIGSALRPSSSDTLPVVSEFHALALPPALSESASTSTSPSASHLAQPSLVASHTTSTHHNEVRQPNTHTASARTEPSDIHLSLSVVRAQEPEQLTVITGTIEQGQTALTLFRSAHIDSSHALEMWRAVRGVYDLQQLRVGQPYAIYRTSEGQIQRFTYDIDSERRFNVQRQQQRFVGRILPLQDLPDTPAAPVQPQATQPAPAPTQQNLSASMASVPAPQYSQSLAPSAVVTDTMSIRAQSSPSAITNQSVALALTKPSGPQAASASTESPVTVSSSSLPQITRGTVQQGQTAVMIFHQAGVDNTQVVALRHAIRKTYDIRHLDVGHQYTIGVDADGNLQQFTYDINTHKQLGVHRTQTGFVSEMTSVHHTRQERVINGTITSSIYAALLALGESPRLVGDLAEIFAWKVDFLTDLRSGDTFSLLIEEHVRKEHQSQYHHILAAELVNQNHVWQAVYHPEAQEYYRPDGRSLRGLFLRSPLRYRRISSHFSPRRLHPILKRYRPHWGVDYAAPRGTPVRTVGDGTVAWVGRKGQNGKMVKIRHNAVYITYYLHLSRYAHGIKKGVRVKQGEVIGYVGATGLATGPHLDFRLTKHGRYINPLTHDSVEAPALSTPALSTFKHFATQQLEKLQQAQLDRSQRVARTNHLESEPQ